MAALGSVMDPSTEYAPWPVASELVAVLGFLGLIIILPALGYFFMVADYRAYLRSFHRAIARVLPRDSSLPEWALEETPRCVEVFGLRMPCDEEELKAAYREKIKNLHPDRGGDQQRFLVLQRHFEEALELVRQVSSP